MRSRPDGRDRAQMEKPQTWPYWPFLPIKRYHHGAIELAVLYAAEPLRIAYGANLWALAKTSATQTTTVDELLREGWMVD